MLFGCILVCMFMFLAINCNMWIERDAVAKIVEQGALNKEQICL